MTPSTTPSCATSCSWPPTPARDGAVVVWLTVPYYPRPVTSPSRADAESHAQRADRLNTMVREVVAARPDTGPTGHLAGWMSDKIDDAAPQDGAHFNPAAPIGYHRLPGARARPDVARYTAGLTSRR